jgi:hypothetical protein
LLLAVVDVPYPDLDPLHERATVRVKLPVAFVVLYNVPRMQVGLAMWARLDLVGGGGDTIATLRVGEHPNVANDLADLGKLESARDR